jgi:hypothetical protein
LILFRLNQLRGSQKQKEQFAMVDRIKIPPRNRLPVRPGKKDAMQLRSEPTDANAQEYLPTEQEFAALKKQMARVMTSQWKPQLKVENGKIVPDHPDKVIGIGLVAEALGVGVDCAQGLLAQLAGFARRGDEIDQRVINDLFALVREIGPTNGSEAMLAMQMAAVHVNAMMVGRRLAISENIVEQDSTQGAFNRLCRTFTTQLETLKRYRTGREDVTVQNVLVTEGGQAVVANVGAATGAPSPDKPVPPRVRAVSEKSKATVARKPTAAVLQFKHKTRA